MLTGLPPASRLMLEAFMKVNNSRVSSFDTGRTEKDPKTKKTVKVIYKATCSSVVLPETPPGADDFSGGAFLYFAPSSAYGFPGLATYKPLPD